MENHHDKENAILRKKEGSIPKHISDHISYSLDGATIMAENIFILSQMVTSKTALSDNK